jgi:hypothetical protein
MRPTSVTASRTNRYGRLAPLVGRSGSEERADSPSTSAAPDPASALFAGYVALLICPVTGARALKMS